MPLQIIKLMILETISPSSLVSNTCECNLAEFTDFFVGVKDVDYAKYPNKNLQMDWLRIYLEEYHNNGTVIEVTDRDVQKLYVETNQFVLASHIFWIIWSLIQAEHSHIDFDFIEYVMFGKLLQVFLHFFNFRYAAIRFKEYFAKKEEFFALSESLR